MSKVFSIYDILGLQDVEKIGDDILLLPGQSERQEAARALHIAGLVNEDSHTAAPPGTWDIISLTERYCMERYHAGREPNWIEGVPISVRKEMRLHWALTEEDALFIIPSCIPPKQTKDAFDTQPTFAAGLSYMVLEGGLCHRVFQLFKLWRLEHIKQLGFLNAPPYNDYSSIRQSLSGSTRWLHSLDVYAISMIIAHNLGLSRSQQNTLAVAALTHDVRTPAGGDSVKMIDPTAFDEDATYSLTLDKIDCTELTRKWGVDVGALPAIIRNEGTLGEILDIADKLAYVGRDIPKCLHHIEAGVIHEQWGLRSLLEILRPYPYVCGIWDCVEVDEEGHIYFSDIQRLFVFLKARVLMFREVYYSPITRHGEFFMSRLFVKMLYDKGELTREMLLDMWDETLLRYLDKRLGKNVEEFGWMVLERSSVGHAEVESFNTLEEAQAFVRKLRRKRKRFAMIDDDRRAIKTSSHFKVKSAEGIKPLREAHPEIAQELDEMAALYPMVHVYYLTENPELPRSTLRELLRYMKKTAAP